MFSYWLVHGNLQHIGEGNVRHIYSQFGRILEIYTAVKHVSCLFVFPKSMKHFVIYMHLNYQEFLLQVMHICVMIRWNYSLHIKWYKHRETWSYFLPPLEYIDYHAFKLIRVCSMF